MSNISMPEDNLLHLSPINAASIPEEKTKSNPLGITIPENSPSHATITTIFKTAQSEDGLSSSSSNISPLSDKAISPLTSPASLQEEIVKQASLKFKEIIADKHQSQDLLQLETPFQAAYVKAIEKGDIDEFVRIQEELASRPSDQELLKLAELADISLEEAVEQLNNGTLLAINQKAEAAFKKAATFFDCKNDLELKMKFKIAFFMGTHHKDRWIEEAKQAKEPIIKRNLDKTKKSHCAIVINPNGKILIHLNKRQSVTKKDSDEDLHKKNILGQGSFKYARIASDLEANLEVITIQKLKRPTDAQYSLEEIAIQYTLNRHLPEHIASLNEVIYDEKKQKMYISQPLYDGTLTSLLENEPKDLTSISGQLLSTINEIHEAGYAHCDLKGDNIFIKKSENQKTSIFIADFGLTTRIDDRINGIIGTPGYLCPEIISKYSILPPTTTKKEADLLLDRAQADDFAAGLILLELYTQTYLPDDEMHPLNVLEDRGLTTLKKSELYKMYNQWTQEKIKQLRAKKIPKPIIAIIEGLTQPDPSKRLSIAKANEMFKSYQKA